MPSKIVKITYSCGICNHEYAKRESAVECEMQGVALPEFKCFEVVEIIGVKYGESLNVSSGLEVPFQTGMKAIIHDNAEESLRNLNPHFLPTNYDVWLSISTPLGSLRRELACHVHRKYLKRLRTRDGFTCPLCKSITVSTQEFGYTYLGLGTQLPMLKRVSAQKCKICNAKFFTDAQSLKTESIIKNRCRWSIANTQKLIQKDAFQY